MDEAVWETMWLWVSQALQEMLAHLKMCHMLDTLLWTCCTLKILLRVQPDYIYYWFYFDNLTNQIREKFVRLMFWYNLQTWSSKFGLRPICHRPDSMYLTVIRRRADFPELLPAATGCWQEMGGGPCWPTRLPPKQESRQKLFPSSLSLLSSLMVSRQEMRSQLPSIKAYGYKHMKCS